MSKETLVFILGFVVLVSSFLGIPLEYKEWLLVGIGVILMAIGYRLRRYAFLQSIEHESGERRADAFVENTGTIQETLSKQKADGAEI